MAWAILKINQLFAELDKPSGFGYNTKRLLEAAPDDVKDAPLPDWETLRRMSITLKTL